MIDFLTQYKPLVDKTLLSFLKKKQNELSKVNPWGNDAARRLTDFVKRGKTIRGSLTIFSYKIFKSDLPTDLLKTAASLELFHSAFLIHDDIADLDNERRGMDALHVQYQKLTKNNHVGTNLAIQLADLAFFLGWELTSPKVQSIVARELANVCAAQMQDIAGKGDIRQLYKYKTARYTFSLPLMIGATFADSSLLRELEILGENLGLLYQIRDDELDQEKKRFTLPVDVVNKQIELLPIAERHKESLLELARFCVIRNK